MIPGNVDPRRPEKVQRYKPPQTNGNAPVEDLTPDYMNILGPDSATANADGIEKNSSGGGAHDHQEDLARASASSSASEANGTTVIPTSPQYGVEIISTGDVAETTTSATDSVVETTAKTHLAATLGGVSTGGAVTVEEGKDMHSTPSRNDRFKVVKIASLEPFRRGRWKCMDYVDENPPQAAGQPPAKQTQSATNIQMANMPYLQTQSLPQQHFQQMLVQGAFAASPGGGFYQGVPNQMLPGQYFYPHGTVISQQVQPVQQQGGQFINPATGQQYFPANVPPHAASAGYTYSNVQYVQPNLIQAQGSAFVPTSQTIPNSANFQQSQTYAGQPTITSTQQPMVNGHAFPPGAPPPVGTDSPQVASLPTQIAKSVILQPVQPQSQPIVSMNQTPPVQNSITQHAQAQYNPSYPTNQSPQTLPTASAQLNNITAVTQVTQGTPIITPIVPLPVAVPPSSQITNAVNQAMSLTAAAAFNQMHMSQMPQMQLPSHSAPASSTNPMYVNAQFQDASIDGQGDGSATENKAENAEAQPGEDPAKANPVVNAIDNKIEQAMDLVKSHLMYTVREEVEVLKEKIVELMERIQLLESENAYLKQQVAKGSTGASGASTNGAGAPSGGSETPDTSQTPTQQPPAPQ